MLVDECESYTDSLAKKAVAFFKMSRSIRNRRHSSRSLCISSSVAVNFPLPGNASCPWSSNSFRHFRSEFALIPRLSAAWLTPYPCWVTYFTASILNSRLNTRRFDISRPPQEIVVSYTPFRASTIPGEGQDW